MKLSRKQRAELEVLRKFVPNGYEHASDNDVARFFAWSDRGVDKAAATREALDTRSGLAGLYWAKQHRDLQVSMFKEDWRDTAFPGDFVDEPESYVRWLTRALGDPAVLTTWQQHNTCASIS